MPARSSIARLGALTAASLFCFAGVENLRGGEPSSVPFEIRGATFEPIDGVTPLPYENRKGLQAVYLRQDVILTLRDLKDVEMVYDAGGFEIILTVLPDVAGRFSEYTASHVGDYTAVLVNGKVVAAPRIGSKMDIQGSLKIGPFSEIKCRAVYKDIKDVLPAAK